MNIDHSSETTDAKVANSKAANNSKTVRQEATQVYVLANYETNNGI